MACGVPKHYPTAAHVRGLQGPNVVGPRIIGSDGVGLRAAADVNTRARASERKGMDLMDIRVGSKARREMVAQAHLPSLDYVLLSSLVAVQFILLMTIVLQVVGS